MLATVQATELYYTNRNFTAINFNIQGNPPLVALLNSESKKLTNIVQGAAVTINDAATYAIEKQMAIPFCYGSPEGAWEAAVAYNGTPSNHPGTFDNVGWVRGTMSDDGEWGAYLWIMQNKITFQSSASAWWTTNGISVAITNVMVGSLGNYQATSNVVDIGPHLDGVTNYPGSNQWESKDFRVDITNVYYQLSIPDIWISPRSAYAMVDGSNVQFTVTGTNIPQGVTWTISPTNFAGHAEYQSSTNFSAWVTPGTVATNYKIRARSKDNTNFYDEVNFTVLKVDFLDAFKNETNTLKVGKWENGFNVGPAVKDNFIDLDPDRFHVRVNDQSKKDSGKVSVKLSTDSAGTDYDDDATEIELTEEPANSGIFISTNMLMISDDVDDDFTNPNVVSDDTKNDRTHKIALGGKVKVQYPGTGTVICEKEASVPPDLKTVQINIIVLNVGGSPVTPLSTVSNAWLIAKERYAQIGVQLQYSITTANQPAGVDLSDGLDVASASAPTWTQVAQESKDLISALGTTNTTADIHAFYVNFINAFGASDSRGVAIADYWFDESEENYIYNFMVASTAGPFTAPHELGHLVGDNQHHSDQWNLMRNGTSVTNGVTESKRLDTTQESRMRGDNHAQ